MMTKYLLAYKGGGTPASEQDRQAAMAAWGQWFGSLGAAVVDGGNPFGQSRAVSAGGGRGDGAGTALTGYSVLQAESLDAAAKMAAGCPILKSGGTVDVYETINVM
jgi:hypothetical protein